jgi:hypothetical protein
MPRMHVPSIQRAWVVVVDTQTGRQSLHESMNDSEDNDGMTMKNNDDDDDDDWSNESLKEAGAWLDAAIAAVDKQISGCYATIDRFSQTYIYWRTLFSTLLHFIH